MAAEKLNLQRNKGFKDLFSSLWCHTLVMCGNPACRAEITINIHIIGCIIWRGRVFGALVK